MTGEYPIAVLGYAPRAYQSRKDVDLRVSYPKEGCSRNGRLRRHHGESCTSECRQALDRFFFSKEGQEILQKYEAVISGRGDLAKNPEVGKIRSFRRPDQDRAG